jgi:hypothetical protein
MLGTRNAIANPPRRRRIDPNKATRLDDRPRQAYDARGQQGSGQ